MQNTDDDCTGFQVYVMVCLLLVMVLLFLPSLQGHGPNLILMDERSVVEDELTEELMEWVSASVLMWLTGVNSDTC